MLYGCDEHKCEPLNIFELKMNKSDYLFHNEGQTQVSFNISVAGDTVEKFYFKNDVLQKFERYNYFTKEKEFEMIFEGCNVDTTIGKLVYIAISPSRSKGLVDSMGLFIQPTTLPYFTSNMTSYMIKNDLDTLISHNVQIEDDDYFLMEREPRDSIGNILFKVILEVKSERYDFSRTDSAQIFIK